MTLSLNTAPKAYATEDQAVAPLTTGASTGVPDTNWYDKNPSASSFTISTADELAGLAQIVNSGTDSFVGKTINLSADIDLSGWNSGASWDPIGKMPGERNNAEPTGGPIDPYLSYDSAFQGIFDGAGHTITGLYINTDDGIYLGLFGYIYNGAVKNLKLENASITEIGSSSSSLTGFAGSIAGYSNGSIENCSFNGTVSGGANGGGGNDIGGIVGYNAGSVSDCNTAGSIAGRYDTGGIAGSNEGNIVNCHSECDVEGLYVISYTGGNTITGGITGNNMGGRIEKCSSKGAIIGSGSVGGIVGNATSGTTNGSDIIGSVISESFSSGTVKGNNWVGGIAGSITYNGVISNCYSSGDVSGDSNVGGVSGAVAYGSIVSNSYSLSAVSGGAESVGGIAGLILNVNPGYAAGSIENCIALNPSVTAESASIGRILGAVNGEYALSGNMAFADMQVKVSGSDKTIVSDPAGFDGESITREALQTAAGFPSPLTQDPWTYEAGKLPGLFGQAVDMSTHLQVSAQDTGWYNQNPSASSFTISTADELAGLAQIVNSGTDSFVGKTINLSADIDLSGWNSGASWDPIGKMPGERNNAMPPDEPVDEPIPYLSHDSAFQGVFDGADHTITGLYINSSDSIYLGLFGYIYDGEVNNLKLENVSVTKISSSSSNLSGFAGSIAGYSNGNIKNCSFTGVINGIGGFDIAGIVGYNAGSMTDCYTAGTITGWSNIGGITGYSTGSIVGCHSNCTVSCESQFVGGVAGYIAGGQVESCSSTGAVDGDGFVGGIVGDATNYSIPDGIGGNTIVNSSVKNSYSTGTITGIDKGTGWFGEYVGGIAGNLVWGSRIADCYSEGDINGVYCAGGIAGGMDYADASVENCYSISAVSSSINWAGGIVGRIGQGNTTIYTGNVTNCFALNSSVSTNGANAGRVVGALNCVYILSGNLAFGGMAIAVAGIPKTVENSITSIDGLAKTKADIQAASGFPSPLTQDPWTYEAGKLPGLFGNAVDMPAHLRVSVPANYALTVVGGTGATGSGTYEAGATVNITAGTPSTGQQFAGWTSSGGGTFGDATSTSTTFTMPAGAVTVTAGFEPIPTYTAEILPTAQTFTGATAGYGAQVAQQFTITNTGTGSLSGLSATFASGAQFEITVALSAASLAPSAVATVSVRPKTGLAAGTYADTLKVTGNNGINLTVPLSFTVAAIDRTIAQGKDNWRFINTPPDFFADGYGTYKITGDYYDAILNAAATGTNYPTTWKQYVLDKIDSSWWGSCFGMSAVLSLTKAQRLTPGFFQAGAGSLYGLSYPKDSDTILNLVNYYHLMQLTPTTNPSLACSTDEAANMKYVVQLMQSSAYPVIISFNIYNDSGLTFLLGGHAVVGYSITEEATSYVINIADPNSSLAPSMTLTIQKDWSSAKFSNTNYYPYTFLKTAQTVEAGKYDYQNIQQYLMATNPAMGPLGLGAASNNNETFAETNYADFTITSSGGESATVAGGKKVSGTLPIGDGMPLNEPNSDLQLMFTVPALSGGETYTLNPAGADGTAGDFETSILCDESSGGYYSRVSAQADGDYVFASDGAVTADFGGAPAEATVAFTPGNAMGDLYTSSVTAKDTSIGLAPSSDPNVMATAEFGGSTPGSAEIKASGDYNSAVMSGLPTNIGALAITGTDTGVSAVSETSAVVGSAVAGYSVSFRTFGGTPIEAITNITPGAMIQAPATPAQQGSVFRGWYTDKELTQEWNFSNPVNASMTLYAKWGDPRVTFSGTGISAQTVDVPYGTAVGTLPSPMREGYLFDGWYTAQSGGTKITGAEKITADVTYYARWTQVSAPAPSQHPSAVTAIRSAQSTFYIVKGKSFTIPYVVDLAPGENQAPVLTWSSDKPANVSVDQNGKVKGLAAGKSAMITVKSDNGTTKTFTVKVVKAAVKATGVTVSKPPKTLKVGATALLKVKVSPSKATGAVVTFKSSKSSVVSVDKAGKVTAIAKGTAKITVKAGGKSTVVTITVK